MYWQHETRGFLVPSPDPVHGRRNTQMSPVEVVEVRKLEVLLPCAHVKGKIGGSGTPLERKVQSKENHTRTSSRPLLNLGTHAADVYAHLHIDRDCISPMAA